MADDESVEDKTGVETPKPAPPHGDEGKVETDWKAESRKWEQRAKENKAAADELESLKQSRMSEQEKLQARSEKLERELGSYKAKEQQSQWKTQVSKDTGVPADVLRGSTLEEIQAHAESLKTFLSKKPQAPIAFGVDRQPQNPAAGQGDWLRESFKRK
ncbi:MAG: helicase [Bifidobacterium sp.]|nr:helicase [Bifidobacterium sp.]MCI1864467.1 helicase [Bifidobacterium sp.]